ncbi:GNAT family N-acetyltransferase [Geomonas nitrogeniifigens]|uniref:GNAT family N-acetyltransferase n=1 Tax=Geomonas diazotrophica TaxID=2843197 RepID=UPI001C2C0424|nr:GNAT family N-acetyltransferase [Geomonas nitrogeniifigens]QXE86464.1 GNAT family N-acetyltransferase [Geomonas nitrogeniifigens]
MAEQVEIFGNSLVQHDQAARRATLALLDPEDAPNVIHHLELLAISRGYTKVTARVPAAHIRHFVGAGYRLEATIPHFYGEGETACFLARHFGDAPAPERMPLLLMRILAATEMQSLAGPVPLPEGGALRSVEPPEIGEVVSLYRTVGVAKSAAVDDPIFLDNVLGRGDLLLGLWIEGILVAACGAIFDPATGTAELAHFVVLPEHRGKGLALLLLQRIGELSAACGARLLWSAVRAYAPGINITFAKGGYHFGGTLTNSTNIYGAPESVNVWHKCLADDPALAWSSLFLTNSD